MTDAVRPSPEETVLYKQDIKTNIAANTLDRRWATTPTA
jgi:hypothetical protein